MNKEGFPKFSLYDRRKLWQGPNAKKANGFGRVGPYKSFVPWIGPTEASCGKRRPWRTNRTPVRPEGPRESCIIDQMATTNECRSRWLRAPATTLLHATTAEATIRYAALRL